MAELLLARKHVGLIVPSPIQAALSAALSDQEHVDVQREKYRRRREVLLPALHKAGFRLDHSEAGSIYGRHASKILRQRWRG